MRTFRLLGPAFVAALAYVDPGNVAANLSAGARHGYLLVWVLVASSLVAMFVQYQSAKLGLVSGSSLTALMARRLDGRPRARWAYGLQASVMAVATDVAEVIGGALALNLLTGLPLWLGGVVTGVVCLWFLEWVHGRGELGFEVAVIAILALVVIGFGALLWWAPPDPAAMLAGLVPRLRGVDTVYLAAAMLGATVMPHAIYVHSQMAGDRHGHHPPGSDSVADLLRVQRWDVGLALVVAGGVNVAMLLFAAAALADRPEVDSIAAGHAAIRALVGVVPATVFALGLLASGVGSSVVGTHAGAGIMRDLLPVPLGDHVRRAVTLVPAVALLATGVPATDLLVLSQALLSFGIVFALVPLMRLTSDRDVMGERADGRPVRVLGRLVVVLIATLNVALLAALALG